jgi:predicted transcriptional regulator of viral defense system
VSLEKILPFDTVIYYICDQILYQKVMNKIKIHQNEVQLIKLLDNQELDIFTYSYLYQYLGETLKPLHSTLENLVDSGLLSRLEKGKYCRHNFRNEYVIANYLVSDGVIAYWSALNMHGLTEQFPNTIFVQTSKLKPKKVVFGVRYQFIKVKAAKMLGFVTEGYGNHQYRMTDIEKTIVDCFDLPEYSGGFAELLRAFSEAHLDAQKMIRYSQAIDNIAAVKRMACLTELLQKPNMTAFLDYAQSIVNRKYNLFDPWGTDKGEFVKTWRLRMNLSQENILSILNKQY